MCREVTLAQSDKDLGASANYTAAANLYSTQRKEGVAREATKGCPVTRMPLASPKKRNSCICPIDQAVHLCEEP